MSTIINLLCVILLAVCFLYIVYAVCLALVFYTFESIAWFVKRKYPVQIDSDSSWWQDLSDDYSLVLWESLRWALRHMTMVESCPTTHCGILDYHKAIEEGSDLADKLLVLEQAATWRKFHCGRYFRRHYHSDYELIRNIRQLRKLQEKVLRTLKRNVEAAEKNIPPDSDGICLHLR